jgi:hypothetical protein
MWADQHGLELVLLFRWHTTVIVLEEAGLAALQLVEGLFVTLEAVQRTLFAAVDLVVLYLFEAQEIAVLAPELAPAGAQLALVQCTVGSIQR